MESVDVGPVVHEAPNESGQLSGDGDHGLVVTLGDGELSVTTGQAQLGRPGVSDDVRRQALRALLEVLGQSGSMSVAPGRLDQDSPKMGIADFGNRAAVLALAARVLRGDQARVAHESSGGRESTEVADLGDEGGGAEGVDAFESTQFGDGFGEGLQLGGGLDLAVHLLEVNGASVELGQQVVEGALEGGVAEALGPNPGRELLTPAGRPGRIAVTLPAKEGLASSAGRAADRP